MLQVPYGYTGKVVLALRLSWICTAKENGRQVVPQRLYGERFITSVSPPGKE